MPKQSWLTTAPETSSGAYLAAYLQRKGSRDITFLEAPAVQVLGASATQYVENSLGSLAAAPTQDLLWWENSFAPDKVTVSGSATPQHIEPLLSVQPMGLVNNNYYRTYMAYYLNRNGTYWYDEIELQESLTYPTGPGGQTNIIAKLEPWWAETWTTLSNGSGLSYNATGWRVGGGGPAGIKLTTQQNSDDKIEWLSDSGTMTHPGGGKFVDWGISWSWQNFLVLTFSLPNGSGQLNLNDNQSFSGDPAQVADSYITSGYLTCAGSGYVGCSTQDNFSVNFQHGPFPTSQYVTDHVDFVYNMLSTTALFGDVTGYCDATYLDDFPINTYTG